MVIVIWNFDVGLNFEFRVLYAVNYEKLKTGGPMYMWRKKQRFLANGTPKKSFIF
jgi:hypothetical protein